MSQETIQRLQARIDQLEQKVSQLEKEIEATDQASGDGTQTAAESSITFQRARSVVSRQQK